MRSASTSRVVAVVGAVVVVVALIVIALTQTGSDGGAGSGAADSEIGECINVRQSVSLAEPVDCAAPDATYVVAQRLEGPGNRACPTETYDMYVQEGTDGDFSLCVYLNGSAGDCFDGFFPKVLKSKVPCDVADVTVLAALDGGTERTPCPEGSQRRLDYPQPAPGRTLCLTDNARGSV